MLNSELHQTAFLPSKHNRPIRSCLLKPGQSEDTAGSSFSSLFLLVTELRVQSPFIKVLLGREFSVQNMKRAQKKCIEHHYGYVEHKSLILDLINTSPGLTPPESAPTPPSLLTSH